MGSSNGFYTSSCPEPVPVTIQVTEVKLLQGGDVAFRNERYAYPDIPQPAGTVAVEQDFGGDYRILTLDVIPFQSESVTVYKNGVAQRPGADYSVFGTVITLTDVAVDGDQFLVNWFASVGATQAYDVTTGYISPFPSDPGDGWLVMDGVTGHSKLTYGTLWGWLNSDVARGSLILSDTPTDFIMKDLSSAFQSGTSLVSLRAYIHV